MLKTVLMDTETPSMPDKGFAFPRHYNFPPFFTRQDNITTLHAQCQKWSSLILSYCRYYKIWKLSLVDALSTDLFNNKKLDKRLSLKDAREMLEFMRKEGRAEWIGKDENVAWIWWRNPEEWAMTIADWVCWPCSLLSERYIDEEI